MMQAEICDPFGTVIAKGELTILDAPGIDDLTPSVAEEISERLVGKGISLLIPGGDLRMTYQLLLRP